MCRARVARVFAGGGLRTPRAEKGDRIDDFPEGRFHGAIVGSACAQAIARTQGCGPAAVAVVAIVPDTT